MDFPSFPCASMSCSKLFKSYGVCDSDEVDLMDLEVPTCSFESERLTVLRQCEILGTEMDPIYDRFTALAARRFSVPIALIPLIDVKRAWLKSRFGLPVAEVPRNYAFCSYTVLETTSRVLYISDLLEDERFRHNPLVTNPPFLRSYFGASIIVEGLKIGTFCLMDAKPRHDFTIKDQEILIDMANIISTIVSARRRLIMDDHLIILHQSILTLLKVPLSHLQESLSTPYQQLRALQNLQPEQLGQAPDEFLKSFQSTLTGFSRDVTLVQELNELGLRVTHRLLSFDFHEYYHEQHDNPHKLQPAMLNVTWQDFLDRQLPAYLGEFFPQLTLQWESHLLLPCQQLGQHEKLFTHPDLIILTVVVLLDYLSSLSCVFHGLMVSVTERKSKLQHRIAFPANIVNSQFQQISQPAARNEGLVLLQLSFENKVDFAKDGNNCEVLRALSFLCEAVGGSLKLAKQQQLSPVDDISASLMQCYELRIPCVMIASTNNLAAETLELTKSMSSLDLCRSTANALWSRISGHVMTLMQKNSVAALIPETVPTTPAVDERKDNRKRLLE